MSTKKSWNTRNGADAPPRAPPREDADAVKRQVVIESANGTFSSARPWSSVSSSGRHRSVSGKYSRRRVGSAAGAPPASPPLAWGSTGGGGAPPPFLALVGAVRGTGRPGLGGPPGPPKPRPPPM